MGSGVTMYHDAPPKPVATVMCRRQPKPREGIRSQYKLDSVASFILTGSSLSSSTSTQALASPFLRVALQFPDDLLDDAVAVVETLKDILLSDPRCVGGVYGVTPSPDVGEDCCCSNNDGRIRFFVVADNTFGSCCPDEITAQHYCSDCLIHFGESCMSRSTRIPVFYVQESFQFTATARQVTQQQEEQVRQKDLSARLVLGAVELLQKYLVGRVRSLVREKDAEATVNLVVVGCHRSRNVVEDAERRWRERHQAGTPVPDIVTLIDGSSVSWCSYELVQSTTNPEQPSTSGSVVNVHAAIPHSWSPSSGECSSWVINGVRFPRAGTKELQYFLFVGPSSAFLPLHILNVHQHNLYHYSQELREVAFEANESPPALIIMDESFGLTGDGGNLLSPLNDTARGDIDDATLETVLSTCSSGDGYSIAADIFSGDTCFRNAGYAKLQMVVDKRSKQRAFNIELIRATSAVGIVVASLSIAGYYETTMLLHKLLRAHGKRSYIIYIGHLNEFKIANFVDTVDCFVTIACPNSREGHFPEKKDGFPKPIVSPVEVLLALRAEDVDSPLYGHPAVFSTTFDSILPLLRNEVEAATGSQKRKEEQRGDCTTLIRTMAGTVMTHDGGGSALDRLYQRTYVGLEPRTGQTPVQTQIEKGRHGIARGYATEKEQ